ncbi:hypothetical protein NQ317_017700 [Molorchus minor]|uniref:THAP-type domain-containing protein n=1 Tax=Molorchus minor TaxID=1323400 RepID=A0ABQ9JMT4_9CUCU|nr:hypothetical protein NQ317_017700 [Molorchus minor]
MGRKCSVKDCLSDSNRSEDMGVTFHKVPMHPDVRPKWISLCRIPEDKKLVKIIYVCSRHFLRADFCNFKGKKYMLRQGVLPSVFPWDKSKLEAMKAEASVKKEVSAEECDLEKVKKEESGDSSGDDNVEIKTEFEEDIKSEVIEGENKIEAEKIKVEPKEKLDEFEKSKLAQVSSASMNFAINSRIEALDFNNEWYPAKIVEVDYEENEVLIHFEKFSSKYDEWICMNSSRLRPLQTYTTKKSIPVAKYVVGERCLAAWSDYRKFPATVTKVMENDTYEVLFDDGFVKTLKALRMSKTQAKYSAPLFDPIKSSKQDRRDKKRKINVAALFRKKRKLDDGEEKPKKGIPDAIRHWAPLWNKGKPMGTESTIETSDGIRNSIIVPDPRPPIWLD